ncbi:caffeic acid 3-O-methyltransferase-like isoform X1 [Mangifera indica]|uniref:caffeic acid 3-O-methyltransferase-like isoform X1 n=1 Tax=Mangifera indica TaxID=29780 RepID=UPI001CFA6060|nr:caffeic acid 3-O-methyltransferase-like isoform X1 [Mangifera indica]
MSSVGNKENEVCMDALLFSSSLMLPLVLKAAVELDLFTIMAKAGPGAYVSAADIASHLPTNRPSTPSMVDSVLGLLASHSMLAHSLRKLEDGRVEKLYSLTPSSQLFVRTSDDEPSLSDVVAFEYHPAVLQCRLHLKDAILEETNGDFFKKIHGMTIFEYMSKDPTFNSVFNKAMAAFSTVTMKGILEEYQGFKGLGSLVDVGGGNGKCLHMITSKYPHIKGINYDLLYVIQSATSYPGIEHVGGDMFSSVPTADAIMLMNVLHDWDDEKCIKILKNCHKALPRDGKVIILTYILPEEPEPSKSSMYAYRKDNIMRMDTPSGRERTVKELQKLCEQAGFSNFQVACSFQGIHSVIEAYK